MTGKGSRRIPARPDTNDQRIGAATGMKSCASSISRAASRKDWPRCSGSSVAAHRPATVRPPRRRSRPRRSGSGAAPGRGRGRRNLVYPDQVGRTPASWRVRRQFRAVPQSYRTGRADNCPPGPPGRNRRRLRPSVLPNRRFGSAIQGWAPFLRQAGSSQPGCAARRSLPAPPEATSTRLETADVSPAINAWRSIAWLSRRRTSCSRNAPLRTVGARPNSPLATDRSARAPRSTLAPSARQVGNRAAQHEIEIRSAKAATSLARAAGDPHPSMGLPHRGISTRWTMNSPVALQLGRRNGLAAPLRRPSGRNGRCRRLP